MKKYFFFALLFVLPFGGQSQNSAPCTTEGFRQFDFWVGEWDVYHTQADTVVGYNHIKRILNDCVIEENWTGSGGFRGKSFNTYNPVDSTWNQVWVDVSGATYHFSGRYQNDVMALKGSSKTAQGTVHFKLNFYFQRPSNTVRQVWEMSKDAGANWATIFDGTYKKRKS